MPKIKTNRSAFKRFWSTGNGKIMRRKAFKNHILTKKGKRRKRQLSIPTELYSGDKPRIRRLVPNI